MTRRFMLVAGAAWLATACHLIGGQPATVTVLLFDRSRSVNPADRDLYLSSLRALAEERLHGGDRLLFAAIGDQTRSSFRAAYDLQILSTDVRLDQEEAERTGKAELGRRIPTLLDAGDAAGSSHILEAIASASEAFRAAPAARHRLILLTDGVEESDFANLDRAAITPQEIERAIARARQAGIVPDLGSVELSMIGVGGRDFRGVEAFWRAFAAASRANLVRYGRLPYPRPQDA